MIEAVIFDVDGTLVDSVGYHAEAWERAFARFGKDVDKATLRARIGKGGDQLMPEFLDDAELHRIGDKLEKTRSEIFKDDYLHRLKGFPGCRALMQDLRKRGLKIALASSAKSSELKVYKEIADIDGLTDVETSSDDAEKSKPHPDIFQAALAKLKVAPSNAVVIGDSSFDAEAARKAGIPSIGVLCGGFSESDLREAGAGRVYRDPADLLAHIGEWAA